MVFLYIDPGTGSMLFTIILGLVGAAIYGFRSFFGKMKMKLSLGKSGEGVENRQPIVLFADDKRYWNVFEPICDELEKRGLKAHYMTASPDDDALKRSYEHIKCEFIGEGNRAFAHLNYLTAEIVLSSTPGLDVYQWKRSKKVKWYAHILHAANDATAYRMFGLDYYDAVLLSGEYQIGQVRALEKIRNLPAKELELVGLPHMDSMLARKQSMEKEGSEAESNHPTTVLLSPSWGINSIFNRYGGRVIDALLKTDFHIIVRPHPQSFVSEKELIDGLIKQYPESDRLEWNRDTDNFDVLSRADIMISDFSGVIFEFALVFDKPVIYADTSFDKSPLDCYWLEEDMWTFSALPRIGAQLSEESLPEIEHMIEDELNNSERKTARNSARDETWVYRGEAAVRVVDYLEKKLRECEKEDET